uniref:BRCT domain-containing protein n=1 Tax=Trieres chinensis TaxID=1514140 RepID=A0A7S2A9W8_TRICV|mmetsp:Transcript_8986/g.19054  ORF Transcript_8986/g.19054 Transcript_8986/m.19054 type:complete len:264 (+) Transcript_8986:1-792(+)
MPTSDASPTGKRKREGKSATNEDVPAPKRGRDGFAEERVPRGSKRRRKRLRSKGESSKKDEPDSGVGHLGKCSEPNQTDAKRWLNAAPLNGLTLAVSTLGTIGEKHSNKSSSYRSIAAECISMGAVVTGQVHKKVFGVICNSSAVAQLTQRVRKALKKGVWIIDVSWLRECAKAGERVDFRPYLLEDIANETLQAKKNGAERSSTEIEISSEIVQSDEALTAVTGWSEPVNLDCCCVCHENGVLDCKWCLSCNITLARRERTG